jgi:hypothetical protein
VTHHQAPQLYTDIYQYILIYVNTDVYTDMYTPPADINIVTHHQAPQLYTDIYRYMSVPKYIPIDIHPTRRYTYRDTPPGPTAVQIKFSLDTMEVYLVQRFSQ